MYGHAGYGRTKPAAYSDWVQRNLLHLDGPRGAYRVLPSVRERAELREEFR